MILVNNPAISRMPPPELNNGMNGSEDARKRQVQFLPKANDTRDM